MNTPPRVQQKRTYKPEEKLQLLENLDIEIADRTRRFEDALSDILARFRSHQEALILRLPRAVRSITMAQFGDLYNGDVQACLRGLQINKHATEPENITSAFRKRKWQESQEEIAADVARERKAARITSPAKPTARTPARQPFNSLKHPQFSHPPLRGQPSRAPPRQASPLKTALPLQNQTRPPSLAGFNPLLPKTPAYPPRRPRRHESLMSINGSPLANPLDDVTLSPTKEPRPKKDFVSLFKAQKSTSELIQAQGQISVPTKDGRILAFDPFLTTPAEIDILEGVTDSAKKAAKEDHCLHMLDLALCMIPAGLLLIVLSVALFLIGTYAILFSAFVPLTGIYILDMLAQDTHYKYVAAFIVPTTTYFVIANWVGWQYYQNS